MSIRVLNFPRTLCLALLCGALPAANAQVMLADFEENSLELIQPNVFLWNQYEGDFNAVPGHPDIGTESVTSEDAFVGDQSFRVQMNDGNLYAQFYTHDGGGWKYMHELTPNWTFNHYNRMRVWMKTPDGIPEKTDGTHDFAVGTYCRAIGADSGSAETGCGHYYHYFTMMLPGTWYQLIIDTHPTHIRGGNGGTETGNREYPTSSTSHNYFDLMTRFYFDFNGLAPSYPANYYIDGVELYHEANDENVEQVYSLGGGYDSRNNTLALSWNRDKSENHPMTHQVRYSFENIHNIGWDNAEVPPNSTLSPPGWGGYNLMYYKTDDIDVSGHDKVYFAVKPSNSNRFRQIVIPLNETPPGPEVTIAPPLSPDYLTVSVNP